MAFPMTPLPVSVEISLDNRTWTDITGDVRSSDQIQITRGRSDWGQRVDAGQCRLTLDNRSGNYSPRNPLGAYYGKIGRNTPIRVSVNTGDVALDLPGNTGDYAYTPDDPALDITGDIDIRVDATLVNWVQPDYPSSGASSFGRTELVAKRDAGQVSWALYMVAGKPYFEYSTDGKTILWFSTDYDVPLTPSGRLAVRFTWDVDDGSNHNSAAFWTAPTINGPWTVLDSGTFLGTKSIYSSTAPVRVGDAVLDVAEWHAGIGRVHAVQIRSGIDGPIVANADFTSLAPGTTSFTDSAGRTWGLSGQAQITNRKTRFVGEVSSWNTRWDTGGFDVTTEVEAAGVLRRLGQGSVPVKSPMYRELTSAGRRDAGIWAYWPMEDGTDATQFASAYDDHPPMEIKGTVSPASYSDWVASGPIPTITTGSLRVNVPPYNWAATQTSAVGFFCKIPAAGVPSKQRLISVSTAGKASVWSLYVDPSGNMSATVFDSDGNVINSSNLFGGMNGREKYFIFAMNQSGSGSTSVTCAFTVIDVADSMNTAVPDNNASTTQFTWVVGLGAALNVGQITQIRFGEDGAMNGTAIGHVTIGRTLNSYVAMGGVTVGWNAEEAASRISRIGLEENLICYPVSTGDELCGVQPAGTVLDIMQAAEDVDEGILAEQRSVLGIRYITRSSMYNQQPTLTLDYTGDDGLVAPLEPVEDDQNVTNDVTVQRTNGASARITQDTGPLSTQAPPLGIGQYDSSYTLNLLDDTQPLQHAGWRLHIGTWNELRYPVVTVDLASGPSSIPSAVKTDVGSMIRVTNPPSWLPPGPIDMIVQGYSETMDQYTWTIAYNCVPAGPWNVAWANGGTTASSPKEFIWADTEGSQLAADLTATDTKVNVFTTSGPVWTPNVRDTPFDWNVGGEVMTVTAPSSLLNSNPFFDSNITGWTGQSGTVTWANDVVMPHPRAVGSLKLAGTGASSASAASTLTDVGSINPGTNYTAGAWVHSVNGSSDIRPCIDWYNASGTFLSTSTGNAQAAAARTWTYLESTYTAPAGASRALVRVRVGNTPSTSDFTYMWAVRITRTASGAAFDSFNRTVSNGWGTADSGQSWVTQGANASDYSVSAGSGVITAPVPSTSHMCLITAPGPDTDMYVDISVGQIAAGAAIAAGLMSRAVDNNNHYMARVDFNTNSTISLRCRKRAGGTETELAVYTAPLTYTTGTWYRLRFRTEGTTQQAKIWLATDPEPDSWHWAIADTSFTAAANIGMRTYSGTGNTNTNPTVQYRNFQIVSPQTYTVTRSLNQIVKAQTAGTAVALATPTYLAL